MKEENTAATVEAAESASKDPKGIGNVILLTLSVLLLGIVWSMVNGVRDQYHSELDATYKSLSNSAFAMRNLLAAYKMGKGK